MSLNNKALAFIKDFRDSGIIEQISAKYDIVMIWLSGSSVLGITDEESDYDLGLLVADNVIFSKTIKSPFLYNYKKENQKYVQCIYNSFDDIFAKLSKEQLAPYRYLGWAQFRIIADEHIIYKNPKHYELIEKLIEHRVDISNNAIATFLQFMSEGINLVKEPYQVRLVKWGKMLSHLCWCANTLADKPQETDTILHIKRTLPADLSKQDCEFAFEKLIYLKNYMRNTPQKSLELPFLKINAAYDT